jgi:SAM-dependent methyltransferase
MTGQPATTVPAIEPRLLRGISVYQDVVLDGQTVMHGARDCPGRWDLIAPHLPPAGAILDVGSNFGWFGLRICETAADCVVASVEADPRSAAVQRQVLQSHASRRMALLTQRANCRLAQTFADHGQQFDAALCLAVLHWMPDHREFLVTLGRITGRLFIEQPHPEEEGAGIARVRREIGSIGPYLRGVFPDRPVERLAELPSHRNSPLARELWMVREPPDWTATRAGELQVDALLKLAPSWPPRSWWRKQASQLPTGAGGAVSFTPRGLQGSLTSAASRRALLARVAQIPEHTVYTTRQRCYRGMRRLAGSVLRRLRCLD